MLTIKENLKQVMTGGKPDRFVNQYEFLHLLSSTPITDLMGYPKRGQEKAVSAWGVTYSWAPDQPGMFPLSESDLVVIKDMENWSDYVKAPDLSKIPEAAWEPYQAEAEQVDSENQYVTYFRTRGLFESSHDLGGIENVLAAFYEYPDELHELFDYLLEYEMKEAELICSHLHPNALFHHDDWGSQIATFVRPDMFEEYFLERYKTLYGYYKDHGVELICHHSDSYAATLVPYMIEMGIDIWQGCMSSNDVPALVKEYGEQITFMGGIDTAKVEHDGWTKEEQSAVVKEVCDACGPKYFIPCSTVGDPYGTYEGAMDSLSGEIAKYSDVYWREHGLA